MSTISSLHQNEMKDLLMGYMTTINSTSTPDGDICEFRCVSVDRVVVKLILELVCVAFATASQLAPKLSALQKSRTAIGLKGVDAGTAVKKEKRGDDNSSTIAEVGTSLQPQLQAYGPIYPSNSCTFTHSVYGTLPTISPFATLAVSPISDANNQPSLG
jgi:hypothetical protein